MFEYRLEHVFSYVVTLAAPPEVIGPVPGGIRANFYVQRGEISGPRLRKAACQSQSIPITRGIPSYSPDANPC